MAGQPGKRRSGGSEGGEALCPPDCCFVRLDDNRCVEGGSTDALF